MPDLTANQLYVGWTFTKLLATIYALGPRITIPRAALPLVRNTYAKRHRIIDGTNVVTHNVSI